MSAMNPDYVPSPTPDGREGIRTESLLASYTLVGFASALHFKDRAALALVSTAQPYTPRAPNTAIHILKDVVRANLTIAFRAIHVFREFADLKDFLQVVADAVGWQRRYFSIIIRHALQSRREYVEKEQTDQFSPSVGEQDKVLPRLVDSFHEIKASPVMYPMTPNRQRYLAATQALFSQLLTNNPSILLRQGTPDPPVFKREDMDWLNMANLTFNSEHSSPEASPHQDGVHEGNRDQSPIHAMAHEGDQRRLRTNVDALKAANAQELDALKAENKSQFDALKAEHKAELDALKVEHKSQFDEVKGKQNEHQNDINLLETNSDKRKDELNFGLGRLEKINTKTWKDFRIQKRTNKRTKDTVKILEARIRALEGKVDMDQRAPKSRRQDDASVEEDMSDEIASDFEDVVGEQDDPEPDSSEHSDYEDDNRDDTEEEESGPSTVAQRNTRGAAPGYGERRTRAGRIF